MGVARSFVRRGWGNGSHCAKMRVQIFMSFSPPVVGCLLKNMAYKEVMGTQESPLATPLDTRHSLQTEYFELDSRDAKRERRRHLKHIKENRSLVLQD